MNRSVFTIKVLQAVFLAAAVCFFAAALFLRLGNEKREKPERIDIAISVPDGRAAWVTASLKDLLTRLEEENYSVEWRSADHDTLRQREDIRELTEKQPEYLLVIPVHSIGLTEVLTEAADRGIRVVLFHGTVYGLSAEKVFAAFGTSLTEQGRECARIIAEYVGGGDKNILELQTENGSSVLKDRTTGFRNQLREYPGLEIANVIRGGTTRMEAFQAVVDYLSNTEKKIDGIFAHNDEAGMGALAALESLGLTDEVLIVSIGGIQDVKQAIRDRRRYVCLGEDPLIGERFCRMVKTGEAPGDEDCMLKLTRYHYENVEEMEGY